MTNQFFSISGNVFGNNLVANYIVASDTPVVTASFDSVNFNNFVIPDNTTCSVYAQVVARSPDGTNHAHFFFYILLHRESGLAEILDVFEIVSSNAPGWGTDVRIDHVHQTLIIGVSGSPPPLYITYLTVVQVSSVK